jgi:hypothetical protein
MNFTESLDRKLEDIQRPPNLPVGHYVWQVTKMPEIQTRDGANGTFDIVKFMLTCVSAHDDVDPDELAEYGDPAGAVVSRDFIFSQSPDDKTKFEQSMFNMRRFFQHLGLDESLTVSQSMEASLNQQVLGKIRHRPDPKDPEVVYQEIASTAAIE